MADIQRKLDALGFDAGTPDGMAGPQTRRAIGQFQSSIGVPVTGYFADHELSVLDQRYAASIKSTRISPPGAPSTKWSAASTTAYAITGDISVSADSVIFGNGATIHITPVSPDKPQVFTLVPPSSNPTLLNGNKLCGSTAPTFIAITRGGNALYMKVFVGPNVPQGRADPLPEPGTCATYNYERPGSFAAAMPAPSPASMGPSFDCRKAASADERAICASADLAAIDRQLADAYSAALASADDATAIKAAQRQWIADRQSCGSDGACLAAAYDRRIAALTAPPPSVADSESSRSRWTATSTTAIAITGDIELSGDTIIFANGARLHLSPVGLDRPLVFAVSPPTNPTLPNGGKLCGRGPPTFVVLARDGDQLYMKVFDGPQIPLGHADPGPEPGTCATYNFERSGGSATVLPPAPPATPQPVAAVPPVPASASGAPVVARRPAGLAPAPLSTFKDCDHCPEMVVIPAGSFMMGAGPGDAKVAYDQYDIPSELPRHQVKIGYEFAIGKFEVTVDEFAAFVSDTGIKTGGNCMIRETDTGPQKGRYIGTLNPTLDTGGGVDAVGISDGTFAQPGEKVTEREPATCISRNEAEAFLGWLSAKTGRHYRLPTEAEWEYATRAGTDTAFFWGNSDKLTCRYANFADSGSYYFQGMAGPCREKIRPLWSAPAGSYAANPWGIYDTSGNVQEMLEDCWHDTYDGAPADGSPWQKADCHVYVARGGDYELVAENMRSADRLFYGDGKDDRANFIGFRVAVTLGDGGWDKK